MEKKYLVQKQAFNKNKTQDGVFIMYNGSANQKEIILKIEGGLSGQMGYSILNILFRNY